MKNCYNSGYWRLFMDTGNPVFYAAAREEMRINSPILSDFEVEDEYTL